jgi:diguanylate cyclase (GGDEF)-like protein
MSHPGDAMSGNPDQRNDRKPTQHQDRSSPDIPVSTAIEALSRELLAATQRKAVPPGDPSHLPQLAPLKLEGAIQINLEDDPQVPVARIVGPASVLLDGYQAIDSDGAYEAENTLRLVIDGAGVSEVIIDLAKEEEAWRVNVDPHRSPLLNAEDLAFRATHDLLTGLANRASLLERMRIALERAERTSSAVALLYLDVDRFKRINDSLGHHIGDAVLVEISKRLREESRPMDLVARLGGDEFIILCEDVQDPRDAAVIAERILESVNEPVVVGDDDVELAIGATIGIAFERNVIDLDGFLRRADQALLRAKEAGRSRFEFYDATQSQETIKRLELEHQLRDAVASEDGLRLEYQPILTADNRTVEAVEALVRWDHPILGTLVAGKFIKLAEESGIIVPLGRWVLAEACRQFQTFNCSINGLAKSWLRNSFAEAFRRIGSFWRSMNLFSVLRSIRTLTRRSRV